MSGNKVSKFHDTGYDQIVAMCRDVRLSRVGGISTSY